MKSDPTKTRKFQIKPHLKSAWSKDPTKDEIFVEFLPSFTSSHSSLSHVKMIDNLTSTSVTESEKRRDYGGCDWLNEISITIRQIKPTSHSHEE